MPNIISIDTLDDPRLDVYARLTEAQVRASVEAEWGIFIAEGVQVSQIALSRSCVPVSMLCEEKHVKGKARSLVEAMGDRPVFAGAPKVLEALTGYPLTRGVLCAFQRPAPIEPDALLQNARRVAVLEGLNDATNVGALFRSAAALGMDAVLLLPTCCDPLSRRALRVSMGNVLQIPWARVDDLEPLKRRGFVIAALALKEDSVSIADPRLKGAERLALALGSEGYGLNPETIRACDYTALIPMHHQVDSLNVAAAGAIAFWETRVGQ